MNLLTVFAWASAAVAASKQYDALQFTNLGFNGQYTPVLALNDPELDTCSCQVGDAVSFSGPGTPFDEDLAVYVRGPLQLKYFYVFTSDDFVLGSNDSSWTAVAGYNGSKAENLTFLTPAGADLKCLGKALTYADSDGTSKADKATLLSPDAELKLNEELVIFSDKKCGNLSVNGDCGVYRNGIPAYHGFKGKAKFFVFGWKLVNDVDLPNTVAHYNKSAILLLNARIPRTSMNFRDGNYSDCLCWLLGCGELAAFEATDDGHNNQFRTTLHSLQNTYNVDQGNTIDGYTFQDTPYGGGSVLIDTAGNVVVFDQSALFLNMNITSSELNKAYNSTTKTQVYDVSKATNKDGNDKSDGVSVTVTKWKLAVVMAGILAMVI